MYVREGPAHQGCWLQKGRASESPLVDTFLCLIWGNKGTHSQME